MLPGELVENELYNMEESDEIIERLRANIDGKANSGSYTIADDVITDQNSVPLCPFFLPTKREEFINIIWEYIEEELIPIMQRCFHEPEEDYSSFLTGR